MGKNKKEVKEEVKNVEEKEEKKQDKKPEETVENTTSNEEENDLTFRKVDMSKTKKENKALKFILILIIILIAAYCVFFSRNFVILGKIYNQMLEIESTSNFSYEIVKIEDGTEILKATYYKNGDMERVDLIDDNQETSIIVDLEADKTTTWNSKNKKYSISEGNVASIVNLPLDKTLYQQEIRALTGLTSFIYSEEYNSKDCYVIMQICSLQMLDCVQKTWIDKATGLVVKSEVLSTTVEYNNIELNNVGDIEVPDLSNYTLTEE